MLRMVMSFLMLALLACTSTPKVMSDLPEKSLRNIASKEEQLNKVLEWDVAKKIDGYAPESVIAAGDRVLFLDNGSACSGQYVSSTGHFLTALHCLQVYKLHPHFKHHSEKDSPDYKAWESPDFSSLPIKILEFKDFRNVHVDGTEKNPSIVGLGRGFFEFPPSIQNFEHFDKINSIRESLLKFQEDFAVLKYTPLKNHPLTCVASKESKPLFENKEMAWVFGYPEGFLSRNIQPQKYVMKGTLYNSLVELRNDLGIVGVFAEESWLDATRMGVLTGTVESGMSGGGVFNKDGRLIGILVGVVGKNYTVFARVDYIKKSLFHTFDCSK